VKKNREYGVGDGIAIRMTNHAANDLWKMAHGPMGMVGLCHPDALKRIQVILEQTKKVIDAHAP
jgi:hypothetical protein